MFEKQSNKAYYIYNIPCTYLLILIHGTILLHLCSPAVKARLIPLLARVGLPTSTSLGADEVLSAVSHDKKADGDGIRYIYVEKIGEFCERREPIDEFCRKLKENWP